MEVELTIEPKVPLIERFTRTPLSYSKMGGETRVLKTVSQNPQMKSRMILRRESFRVLKLKAKNRNIGARSIPKRRASSHGLGNEVFTSADKKLIGRRGIHLKPQIRPLHPLPLFKPFIQTPARLGPNFSAL
jgi:hypothetical protein